MKASWKFILLGALMFLPYHSGMGGDLFAIDINRQILAASSDSPKLATAIYAVKAGDGVLKGIDSEGHPLVLLTPQGKASLEMNRAIKSVNAEVPVTWLPVTRLKVSYSTKDKLTASELSKLGLNIVEDYAPGAFMLVEPSDGQISAALIDRLEQNSKVLHISPVWRAKAVD